MKLSTSVSCSRNICPDKSKKNDTGEIVTVLSKDSMKTLFDKDKYIWKNPAKKLNATRNLLKETLRRNYHDLLTLSFAQAIGPTNFEK